MEISIHIWTSIALAVLLYPFFGWISVFAIAGGYLIDFDHYILYVIRKKDWSLKRAIAYYRTRRYAIKRPVLHIFHTIEAFAVLIILAFYNNIFMTILAGYLLHMLLDFSNTAYHKGWDDRVNSIFAWLFLKAAKNI
ncbi:hypothetical protein KY349_02390 [Candidatus Woesearchaeota archaeon]|nr:hypothetical protein [Candidatus Woesearchaeota archaeon]